MLFLRRIEKEKKQQDVKMKFMAEASVENFVENATDDYNGAQGSFFVDELRSRIDTVKSTDRIFRDYSKKEKRKRRTRHADSDLSEFLE